MLYQTPVTLQLPCKEHAHSRVQVCNQVRVSLTKYVGPPKKVKKEMFSSIVPEVMTHKDSFTVFHTHDSPKVFVVLQSLLPCTRMREQELCDRGLCPFKDICIYMYTCVCVYMTKKKSLNDTLAVDLPFKHSR